MVEVIFEPNNKASQNLGTWKSWLLCNPHFTAQSLPQLHGQYQEVHGCGDGSIKKYVDTETVVSRSTWIRRR